MPDPEASAIPKMRDPLVLFDQWFAEAAASEPNDPNAMALATADAQAQPSVRMVLLKEHDARGFVFYSNQDSRKGGEIAANPRAAMLFHWKTRRRQIRIEGPLSAVEDAEADAYFASRPRRSQLGAWASPQSRVMADRASFLAEVAAVSARFAEATVPRPPYWSGWRLAPVAMEFWQDMPFRLHDRVRYLRGDDGWEIARLYP